MIVGPARLRGDEGGDRVPGAPAARAEGQGRARPRLAGATRPRAAARRTAAARPAGRARRPRRGAHGPQADAPPGPEEGRPAMVTVSAPPASGSRGSSASWSATSRGSREFVYWRRGRCLAYGNTSYSALADAIKAQCEILEDDPTEVAAGRSTTSSGALRRHGGRAAGPGARRRGRDRRVHPRGPLRRVATLPGTDGRALPVGPGARGHPLGRRGLLDFVEHVADWAQGPILMLALARPELFDVRPRGAAGSATRPRSTSIR